MQSIFISMENKSRKLLSSVSQWSSRTSGTTLKEKDLFLVVLGETFNSQMVSSEFHNFFLTYVASIKSRPHEVLVRVFLCSTYLSLWRGASLEGLQ